VRGRLFPIGSLIYAYLKTQVAVAESWTGWNPDNLSPAEVTLSAALYEAGLGDRFDQQARIGRYTVDFWFPGSRLAVEIDGRAYHQDIAREIRRDRALIAAGARRVIHIAAATAFDDPDGCVKAISYYAAAPC
jgi:very-short-patch-repair endonuclease